MNETKHAFKSSVLKINNFHFSTPSKEQKRRICVREQSKHNLTNPNPLKTNLFELNQNGLQIYLTEFEQFKYAFVQILIFISTHSLNLGR